MKIRIYGFQWLMGRGITIHDFVQHLRHQNGMMHDKRILTVGERDGFITGLFLTAKDMKTFCTIQSTGGTFRINAEQLEEGTHMADFNFFLIHPLTGRGLYQHYHQSSAATTFCKYCKNQYALYRDIRIEEDLLKRGYTSDDHRQRDVIRQREYKGLMKYEIMTRPESFSDHVRALRNIKAIVITPSSLGQPENLLVPDRGVAKKISHRIYFDLREGLWARSKEAVIGLLGRDMQRATAIGVDVTGQEIILKLEHDYQYFHEYEYEDLASTVDLQNLNDSVQNTHIMNCLIDLACSPRIRPLLERSSETQ